MKGDELIVISENIRAPFEFDDELSEDQEQILKKYAVPFMVSYRNSFQVTF